MQLLSSAFTILFTLIGASFFMLCANAENHCIYNLASPDAIYSLPDPLREISALAYVDSESLICVQDEDGTLFTFNPETKRITKTQPFDKKGDYEGIAKVGSTIYVLRSDGDLFEITDYSSEKPHTTRYKTGIPAKNNEGLCHDPTKDRLLIAAKSKSGKGTAFNDKRMVYAFSLKTKKTSEKPVITFDLQDITQFLQNAGINIPQKKKKKHGNILSFTPSAIGIHPSTGDLYVLSGSSRFLFVFNMEGAILYANNLDHTLFNQAEGITFSPSGDMFISNEARNGKPATILLFKNQSQQAGIRQDDTSKRPTHSDNIFQ
ncbi:MAG: hypothetical protein EOL87_13940 [Spartobacteria bacterium]|nr:hypothetical protein [Spartobacteria bacterium]